MTGGGLACALLWTALALGLAGAVAALLTLGWHLGGA
jgi:hypothetical protein